MLLGTLGTGFFYKCEQAKVLPEQVRKQLDQDRAFDATPSFD